MNITDIGPKAEVDSNEKSSLVTRIAEMDETPVLTLVDTVEPTESESRKMPDPLIQALVDKLPKPDPDPLIQALVDKLPKPDSAWSIEDRSKWLRAAAIIFSLIYKPGEANEAAVKVEKEPSVLKSAG